MQMNLSDGSRLLTVVLCTTKLMSADVSGAGRSFTLAAQNLLLAGNYIFSIVCYSLHANLTDKKLQTEHASKTCTETRN